MKSQQTPNPVAVTGLVKTFGKFRALDGLYLTVEPGQTVGFLGPNGAGKSTTIRVLLGLLRANGGQALLYGRDPWRDAEQLHRQIAYVPGDVSLWPNLTGGEAIDLLARLRGGVDPARRAELLDAFDLDPTKKARTYSKGNRQKVALVAALASNAPLLILDEPTSGLDPLMEQVFTEQIRAAKARGQSVLLSSHIMSEVEKVCDTVTIIRQGRTVQSGTLAELRHLTRNRLAVVVPDGADPNAFAALEALPGVHSFTATPDPAGTRLTFDVDSDAMAPALAAVARLGVGAFTAAPPSLEELFMRHYHDAPDLEVAA